MGHARQERVKMVGTRSADYIRASGHCGCITMGQASTRKQAVYMAAPERFAESQICSCNAGTVHTWPISTNEARQNPVVIGGTTDEVDGSRSRHLGAKV